MDMNVLRYIFYVTFIFHLFILSVYFLEKFLKVIHSFEFVKACLNGPVYNLFGVFFTQA